MQKAVAIYEALTISDPTNMDNYSDLANGCTRLSSMQEQRGNLTSAVSVLHKALAVV